MNNVFLIIAIDFGSNSNKYLFSKLDINNKVVFFFKDFVVHKVSSIFNKTQEIEIMNVISDYKKLLQKFFQKIKNNLEKFKKLDFNYIYIISVGTEFYRKNDKYYIKEIIKLNNTELNNLKSFLEKKYKKKVVLYPLEIISQEKESELVFIGLNNLINNIDNFILVDLGGASTELTIKKNNYINKILLNTGAVYFNNQIDLNSVINDYSENIRNIDNVILVGGSFVSLFFSIQKYKIFKKFNILNNNNLLYLFNILLYNSSYTFINLFKLLLFNILRRVLLIEKIFKFSKKMLYVLLFIIFIFLSLCFIVFLILKINLKFYIIFLIFILSLIIVFIGVIMYLVFKVDDYLYNLIDNFLLKFYYSKDYIFFKEINSNDIIEFYTFIKNLDENRIEEIFWDLKNRGDSIKNALIFILSFLNILKPANIYITNITLLEGLVFSIISKINNNIITKNEENN